VNIELPRFALVAENLAANLIRHTGAMARNRKTCFSSRKRDQYGKMLRKSVVAIVKPLRREGKRQVEIVKAVTLVML